MVFKLCKMNQEAVRAPPDKRFTSFVPITWNALSQKCLGMPLTLPTQCQTLEERCGVVYVYVCPCQRVCSCVHVSTSGALYCVWVCTLQICFFVAAKQ